jgi:hypothetical protein
MKEHAKQKPSDFTDKEIATEIERKRCLKFIDYALVRTVPLTEYQKALAIVTRAMIYDGSDYDIIEFERQIGVEKQYLIGHKFD